MVGRLLIKNEVICYTGALNKSRLLRNKQAEVSFPNTSLIL